MFTKIDNNGSLIFSKTIDENVSLWFVQYYAIPNVVLGIFTLFVGSLGFFFQPKWSELFFFKKTVTSKVSGLQAE